MCHSATVGGTPGWLLEEGNKIPVPAVNIFQTAGPKLILDSLQLACTCVGSVSTPVFQD